MRVASEPTETQEARARGRPGPLVGFTSFAQVEHFTLECPNVHIKIKHEFSQGR